MDYKEHSLHVGHIHLNLAALESWLRFFLLKVKGETFTVPKPADKDVPINYMTGWHSLGELIRDYNNKLSQVEKAKYSIDDRPVRIRDALAHGRLVAPSSSYPLTLWKFGQYKSGRAKVDLHEVLTVAWLEGAWKMIDEQKNRVEACSKQRGFPVS